MLKLIKVKVNNHNMSSYDDMPYSTNYVLSAQWGRIYFEYTKETVLDNLVNRHFRPWIEMRKLLPEILSQVPDIDPNKIKIHKSIHAGCRMCPCSPGFIMAGEKRYDIWATVEGSSIDESKKENRDNFANVNGLPVNS